MKVEVELSGLSCVACGVQFWITEAYATQLEKTCKYFFCPNSCEQRFVAKKKKDVTK